MLSFAASADLQVDETIARLGRGREAARSAAEPAISVARDEVVNRIAQEGRDQGQRLKPSRRSAKVAQRAQDGGRPHMHLVAVEQQDRPVESAMGQADLLQYALTKRGLRAGELQPTLGIARQAEGDEATAQHAMAVEKIERLRQVTKRGRDLHAGRPNSRKASTVSAAER